MTQEPQPWKITFEVDVPPGKFAVVHTFPHCLFRGEELIAEESIPGATRVLLCFVGSKLQMPTGAVLGKGVPTSVFNKSVLGSGTRYDTCDKALAITYWIANDAEVPVKWRGVLRGKAVL